MPRLFVNSPSGEQIIIEISATGDYYDVTKIVWDESKDGPMPDVTLGKMARSGNSLTTLPDYIPEHAAAIYAKASPRYVPMPAAKTSIN